MIPRYMLDTHICNYLIKHQPPEVAEHLATPERQRNALDKLIASHALSMGVTLVTNNVSDCSAHSALKVENWVGGH